MFRHLSILSVAFGVLTSGSLAKAGLVLTAEAAGVQATTVANVTTESFDGIAKGAYTSLTTSIGTFSAPSPGLEVLGADAYGGAGGTGNYLAIGAESGSTITTTLTLNGQQSYFGMWWAAADPLNSMEFLENGQVIASFSSATALSALGWQYMGNPNNGQDGSEKFAYLNFVGTAGTQFNQIIFNNQNNSTGFEMDNLSVSSASNIDPNATGTIIPGVEATPAPPAIIMTSLGLICGSTFSLIRRKRAAWKAAALTDLSPEGHDGEIKVGFLPMGLINV